MPTSKIPLTITYRHSGAESPVFVAGPFSGSEWQPKEMEKTVDENGDQIYRAEVLAEAGSKVQYKFRFGNGNTWVLDEAAPIEIDDAGNRYNVMDVPRAAGSPGASGSHSGTVKPVPKAVAEIKNRSAPRSGTSTPIFARTAAEVADSAATLDKEESEPEISDGEAGRKGVRRLSSTPIPEVASTAAEVANTAETLDADEAAPGLVLRPVNYDNPDPWESDDLIHNQNATPLFSHECVGMYDDTGGDTGRHGSHDHDDDTSGDHFDSYTIDPDDPTLERFPSNWEEIADTVRKLEGGLNEDHVTVDGKPLSPTISPLAPRRLSCDPAADLVSSPVAVSPVAQRKTRHLEVPRSPHGSVSSDRSSALSLHSIPEASEVGIEEEDETYPAILGWEAASVPRADAPRSCSSEESDGVVMKGSATKVPALAAQKQ